jgi:hypothetical protein
MNAVKLSFLQFFMVLLLGGAHDEVTARPPFGVPTFAPLTKRFNKKRLSAAAVADPKNSVGEGDNDKGKSKSSRILGAEFVSSLLHGLPLRLFHRVLVTLTVQQVCRFAVLLVGWSLALIVFFPNIVMLTDSSEGGSLKAILASQLGVAACLLLLMGGCAGYANHNTSSSILGCWKALIPGLCCQALMLLLLR